jgi:nitroreductase
MRCRGKARRSQYKTQNQFLHAHILHLYAKIINLREKTIIFVTTNPMKAMRIAKFSLLAAFLTAAAACAPKQQEAAPSALETIFSRKSVRTYTDQPVSDEQVETLLRAAMAAPSGMNVQPWRFVVVRDQAVKDVLAGGFNKMIAQAPVVFVICGETTMMRKPWGQPDAEPVEMANGNWVQDCSAATENLLLAAEALGLGAVWTAAYPYEDRVAPIREALGLPDNVAPLCVVPVGYPGGDDQPKDKWKPENIHYDKW